MTVTIRRASARFVDKAPGRVTHHAFAFGSHYDAEHVSFGPLVCHDDHLLGSGQGFDEHRHADLEIVTWVVAGAVEHRDSSGARTVVDAGSVAVLSAGSGVSHSEHATTDGPARFIQMWLTPEVTGTDPSYAVDRVTLPPNELVAVASPRNDSVLSVVRLDGRSSVTLPTAPRVHVFVASGALLRSSLAEPLSTGDAFLMTDEPEHHVAAGVPTELLVWTFSS
ncbi:MAG: pirin family protein [Nocardioides sp.]|nr:pirin family protein [Nocardioides sp.]